MMILGNALAQCWGNDDHAVYNNHASKTVFKSLGLGPEVLHDFMAQIDVQLMLK
jgi:hypothetical protein